MVENNTLFLNLEFKMEMFYFMFTQFWQQKKYVHPHKPDHVWTSPNTIFSDGMCRNKVQSSENWLKMLSEQKRQINKQNKTKQNYKTKQNKTKLNK